MGLFNRSKPKANAQVADETAPPATHDATSSSEAEKPAPHHRLTLPTYNHNGHLVTKGIKPEGESGRSGIHPLKFLRICFRSTSSASMVVNVLWPFVPAAIAIHFARPDLKIWIFALNYIAMVPTANLIGFAGQELARKLPKVVGIVLETTIGSMVEIVLFMVLIHNSSTEQNLIPVIQAAILGSILTNLLLCLGLCFFVGGLRRDEQEFHEVISETGTGLLLVAGFGLLIPSAFYAALSGVTNEEFTDQMLSNRTTTVSRSTAVVLLIAFIVYETHPFSRCNLANSLTGSCGSTFEAITASTMKSSRWMKKKMQTGTGISRRRNSRSPNAALHLSLPSLASVCMPYSSFRPSKLLSNVV